MNRNGENKSLIESPIIGQWGHLLPPMYKSSKVPPMPKSSKGPAQELFNKCLPYSQKKAD